MKQEVHIDQIDLILDSLGANTKTIAQLDIDYPNAKPGQEVHSDTELYKKSETGWIVSSKTPPGAGNSQIVGSMILSDNQTTVLATDWAAVLVGSTVLAVNEGAFQFWSMELRRDLSTTLFQFRLMVEFGDGNGYNELMLEEGLHLENNKWTSWQYTKLFRFEGKVNWRLEFKKLQPDGVLELRRRGTSYFKSST